MYRILLALHQLALRLGISESFFALSGLLHRKLGFPALQPVRVKR